MKEAQETIRLEHGHNVGPRGIRVIPYCLYKPRNKRKATKGKARRA